MENKKQVGSSSSSSSFTADVFGSKESTPPSASTGFFASVFPPPSPAAGGDSSCSELMGYMQKQLSGNHVWRSTNQGTADFIAKKSEGAGNSIANKERTSVVQESVEHCPLSSSLYYGGQEDMYIRSSSTQTSSSYPIFKKNAVEDDPNGNNSQGASRGNWWVTLLLRLCPAEDVYYGSIYQGKEFTKPPQEFDLAFIKWKICGILTKLYWTELTRRFIWSSQGDG
ncbi:unnamed protein product [Camellia sinensis]